MCLYDIQNWWPCSTWTESNQGQCPPSTSCYGCKLSWFTIGAMSRAKVIQDKCNNRPSNRFQATFILEKLVYAFVPDYANTLAINSDELGQQIEDLENYKNHDKLGPGPLLYKPLPGGRHLEFSNNTFHSITLHISQTHPHDLCQIFPCLLKF